MLRGSRHGTRRSEQEGQAAEGKVGADNQGTKQRLAKRCTEKGKRLPSLSLATPCSARFTRAQFSGTSDRRGLAALSLRGQGWIRRDRGGDLAEKRLFLAALRKKEGEQTGKSWTGELRIARMGEVGNLKSRLKV